MRTRAPLTRTAVPSSCGQVPYNLCRNLEWQVCAAKGKLPGQGGRGIRFAIEPGRLDTDGDKPFAQCGGWSAPRTPAPRAHALTRA